MECLRESSEPRFEVVGEPTDLQLIELVQAKDEGAFGILLLRYAAPMRAVISRRVKSSDVEDVYFDAAQRIWFGARTFSMARSRERNDSQAVARWAMAVTVNCIHDYLRRLYRHPETSDEVALLAAADKGSAEGDLELLDAIEKLPRRQRDALVRKYLGGYSVKEIATAMQIAPKTVESLLYQARERLANSLKSS